MAKLVKCTNCSGTGRVAHYAHIDNGVCYVCSGTGKCRADLPSKIEPWNQLGIMYDQMQSCGKYTQAEADANWEWYLAKRTSGCNYEPFLEAFRKSLIKRGVKPAF